MGYTSERTFHMKKYRSLGNHPYIVKNSDFKSILQNPKKDNGRLVLFFQTSRFNIRKNMKNRFRA